MTSHKKSILPGAIVFDLDGTLVESSGDMASSINEFMASRRLPPCSMAQIRQFIGDGADALVVRALNSKGVQLPANDLADAVASYNEIYRRRLTETTAPYVDAPAALASIKAQGVRIGICTNKTEELAFRVVESLSFHHQIDIIVGARCGRPLKPSPIPLLDALKRLGASTEDAIMVGDSAADVECAKAAGVPIVCVSFGYSRVPVTDLGADIVIDSYIELENACRALKARIR